MTKGRDDVDNFEKTLWWTLWAVIALPALLGFLYLAVLLVRFAWGQP